MFIKLREQFVALSLLLIHLLEEFMATLKDVARETGLTVSTVSRILNNRGYISDSSREKVNEAMKKLNYQPNEVARSLSKKTSNTIGVILPHISHPYFARMISCLEEAADECGYKILLFNSKNRDDRQEKYVEICKSNRVAGVILMSGLVSMENLRSLDVPLVTIERNLEWGTASIECDNYHGGILAAEHLISKGCTKLLEISGVNKSVMPADDRELGFIKACEEHGIAHIDIKTSQRQYNEGEYHEFLEQILRDYCISDDNVDKAGNTKVDGIFASSDMIAAQVIQAAVGLGIRIPEDLKLVGFDDTILASLTTPTITAVHQPIEEMGRMAVSLLLKAADGEVVPTRTVLPVKLVERDSTGR